ncbi:hypothetical protein S245_069847, partial [Arachis hypogaea]
MAWSKTCIASLLITSSRYIKIWHRTTKYIGILIYLKKSTPYTALPPASVIKFLDN